MCIHIILTGTDPSSKKGGIAFALPGYLAALDAAQISYEFIPTHHPTAAGGKWWWWLRALPKIGRHIFINHFSGRSVILYSHPGAGISLARQGFLLAISRLLGAKAVMQLHAPEIDRYLQHPWQRFFFRLAVAPASALGVLTVWWWKRLSSAGIRNKMFVIPNPLPPDWEQRALSKRICARPKDFPLTVLTLARIVPGKGADLVVEAFAFLPESMRLIVAGDGSQLDAIKHRADELGISSRVEFTGWVIDEAKQKLFDQADLFCLPSDYDSFGMIYLEAMANGLPVVALDWGPISDVVPHGRCGLLIKQKDPEQLAEAICSLMAQDLRQRMGESGQRWVIEQFSARKVGQSIRSMLEEIVRKN